MCFLNEVCVRVRIRKLWEVDGVIYVKTWPDSVDVVHVNKLLQSGLCHVVFLHIPTRPTHKEKAKRFFRFMLMRSDPL